MGEITRLENGNGDIERFGATVHITDQLIENFEDRGRRAARLLLVTLSETSYSPVIVGEPTNIDVTNIYRGGGDGESIDLADEATLALEEFISADVPGAKRIRLNSLRTGYRGMARTLFPGIRDSQKYRDAFEDSFVGRAIEQDIRIESAQEGLDIIRMAPRKLTGLRLSDHNRFSLPREEQKHDLITDEGRLMTVISSKRLGSSRVEYFLGNNPTHQVLRARGGRPPFSTIVSEISDRVTKLRTRHSQH